VTREIHGPSDVIAVLFSIADFRGASLTASFDGRSPRASSGSPHAHDTECQA
jgi:hypothetical protein